MHIRYFLSAVLLCIVFLLLLFIGGCEFHSDNEYFREVQKTDSAAISISLDPSDSIVYLAGDQRFNYLAITDSLKCYNVKVFVDTTKISDIDEAYGSFNLSADDYADGHYVLTIVATTSSGSGSLADVVGAEGFLFSFSWDMFVDKSPPVAVQITNIFNDDGILKIEWEKYEKSNFSRYEVVRTFYNGTGIPYSISLAVIHDQNQNYYQDDTYLGGEITYQVKVFSPMNKIAISEAKTFIDEGFSLQAEWIENDLVKLSWNKCKYPKAFKEYRVFQNQQFVYSSADAESNQVIKNIGILGEKARYELVLVSKGGDTWGRTYAEIYHSIGIPMMAFEDFVYNQGNESVYMATKTKLYKYNTDNRNFIDSAALAYEYPEFILSPDNEVLLYIYPKLKVNTDNLTQTETINQGHYGSLRSLSADSRGLLNTGTAMALYDFAGLQVISPLSGSLIINEHYITEDAKYVFEENNFESTVICDKLEGGSITKIWQTPMHGFSLIPGEPDKVLILNKKVCEIRSIATNQVLSSFNVDSFWISGIDPANTTVMFYLTNGNSRVAIYNYQTGEKLTEFAVSILAGSLGTKYFRGSVYSSTGYELPLVNLFK